MIRLSVAPASHGLPVLTRVTRADKERIASLLGHLASEEEATTDSPAVLLESFERAIRERCDLLRQTAEELRTGEINVWHAANRISKIANEIALPTPSGGER